MGILLKRIVLIITTTIAFSTIVMAASEPTDEMRSLVITADYEPVNINKASAARIAAAMKGGGPEDCHRYCGLPQRQWAL